jgi:biopolymer transport protein ExbD
MNTRLGFAQLSSAFSAALAAVVITLLFALYLPCLAIICEFSAPVDPPDVGAGDLYWQKPDSFVVSVHKEGNVFFGTTIVPVRSVTNEFRRAHALWPDRALELRVDRRVTLGELEPVLSAARESGYATFYVFGREKSVLQLTPL